jgi:hypothetical protein
MPSASLLRERPSHLIIVTCLAICVGGCGLSDQQRAAVQRFSAATIDFSTLLSAEFVRSRTDILEMNTLRVQLNDDTVKLGRMDEHFTVERVKVRVDAMRALKEYAVYLHTLLISSQQDELRNAADSFVSSLRKVQGVRLSDDKAGAIGLAVPEMGGLTVEYWRARAIREVVTARHGTILQLLELVQRDFDPKADHWSLGYEVVIHALVGATYFSAVGRDAAIRAPLIDEAKVAAERNRARFSLMAMQIYNAAAALREAQIDLRDMLQGTGVTLEDMDGHVVQIQDFVEVYRNLRE